MDHGQVQVQARYRVLINSGISTIYNIIITSTLPKFHE